ncbi:MAG: radical SAM protein [Kiritimatiellia bacterium]
MVTHACNLNCTYCYEEFKGDGYMDKELAISIVQKELALVESSDKFEALQIDFMGGEPLMNFPLIKYVVEWVEAHPPKVPFVFFATTNGTLLTREMKSWFREHRENVWLGASCDGTESMQNANRGIDQKTIDYNFFKQTWPLQSVHMTISKGTLPLLARGVLFLQRERNFRVEAALAQGIEWTKDDAILYRDQLRILGEEYIRDATIPPINLLGQTLAVELPKDNGKATLQKKFCGTGTHMVTYDIDGRKYGCHLFTPVVLGDSRAEIDRFNWEDGDLYNDSRCNCCVLRHTCPTCAGFNFKYRGAIAKRDMRGCLMALARAISVCEFQIRLIINRRGSNMPHEDAIKAQKAMEAYDILSKIDFPNVESPFVIGNSRIIGNPRKGGEKNESQQDRIG